MDSDDDARIGGAGGADTDDVNLPKATVAKIVSELLPPEFSCAKDAKDLMTECCKEFVLTIASEANEICDKDSKKTMVPEHILAALKSLGFEDYVEEVESILSEHKELAKGERQKKATKKTGSGLSPEELLKIQEEMFAASKAKLEAGGA
ncbi:histone-fold-containing protein [Leucosporidium creatinivorum]|uniref:Histone-fold-containing protein n=1 Tax=Leucosporidium creatinivorum TaxID=106004 RepID=A0A1Y2FYX5_9BASI|nr:histone-fold-containing protein [Leucosporidium creatinivorum]